MNFDVKNTTKISVLDLLCPYTCRGCGRMGELFCECCKKYINLTKIGVCPKCKNQKCDCNLPFIATFVVGWREGILVELVEEFKYGPVRGMANVLGEMMAESIDEDFGVGEEVVVVPLPTARRHVRERGMDHTLMLAKKIAKLRGWKCEKSLVRTNNAVQVGADEKTRVRQAKSAYTAKKELDSKKLYVLVDDVWTTGASMLAAAEEMQRAGAKKLAMSTILMGR